MAYSQTTRRPSDRIRRDLTHFENIHEYHVGGLSDQLGRSTVVTTKSNAVQQDDRRSRRAEVKIAAIIDAGPGRVFSVMVHNVSAHGIMAELSAQLVPGRPVTVDLAGVGRTAGRVAWLRDGHVGIAFVEPLTLNQISAIL
jgi:hypothetical protein